MGSRTLFQKLTGSVEPLEPVPAQPLDKDLMWGQEQYLRSIWMTDYDQLGDFSQDPLEANKLHIF